MLRSFNCHDQHDMFMRSIDKPVVSNQWSIMTKKHAVFPSLNAASSCNMSLWHLLWCFRWSFRRCHHPPSPCQQICIILLYNAIYILYILCYVYIYILILSQGDWERLGWLMIAPGSTRHSSIHSLRRHGAEGWQLQTRQSKQFASVFWQKQWSTTSWKSCGNGHANIYWLLQPRNTQQSILFKGISWQWSHQR